MNLLANAINYAHKNSIVKINAVNDRGYFRFYVENSGEYIENEIINGDLFVSAKMRLKTRKKGEKLRFKANF